MILTTQLLALFLAGTGSTRALEANPHSRPPIEDLETIRRSRMHYEEREDGSISGVGADYKTGFTSRGAEYLPKFGLCQSESDPLELSPVEVTVAGQAIEFESATTPRRTGDRVSFARGGFSEHYDLLPGSMEQTFVFESLPSRGELILRIPVATSMSASEDEVGLTFENDCGRVTYTKAVAIDARGHRVEAATDFADGSIVIRVDAAFVIDAELPLVVDPVVTTFAGGSGSTVDEMAPDCLWDPVGNVWFMVYQTAFSATDYDLFAYSFDATLTNVFSATVESGSGSWTNPRCAALPGSDIILVVAEVATVSPKIVVARRVNRNVFGGISTDPTTINIGGSIVGDLTAPDVGGDPYAGTPAYFCVVFTHALSGLEKEIGYRLVSPTGALVGTGPTYFAHASGTSETGASISTSNDENFWTIAWQRTDTITPGVAGIYGARVQWNGALAASFLIRDSALFERGPSVSSPIPGTNRVVVAYRQSSGTSGQGDIGLTALDGTTVLSSVNLTALDAPGTQALNQDNPTVETEGSHFLVVYPEFETTAAHFDLYCSQVLLSGTQLSAFDDRALILNAAGSVRRGRVAGKLGSTGSNRFFAVFDFENSSPTERNVGYALVDTITPGSNTLFCYGDGTGSACPCGNSGAVTHGCAHSTSTFGGWLLKTGGNAAVSLDTALITIGNLPPGAPVLFFQGTTQLAGSAFGDGLLCLGGTIVRLGVVFSSGGLANAPQPLSVLGGVPASGGMRAYQAWYRDSATFCSSSTFNLSNGLAIYWAP